MPHGCFRKKFQISPMPGDKFILISYLEGKKKHRRIKKNYFLRLEW